MGVGGGTLGKSLGDTGHQHPSEPQVAQLPASPTCWSQRGSEGRLKEEVRKGHCVGGGPGRPAGASAAARGTALHVARLAEEMVIQGVAALVRGLHRQEDTAVLTSVAVFMEVSSHALDFEGVLPVLGDDGIPTDAAHGGKFPVEVIQAVHLVLAVQGKALVPDAPGAAHTGEAGGVEGLAQGPDDVVPDHLSTLATLLQGVLVAGFTEGPPILLVEALPGQLAAAGAAGEALCVVLSLHGLHGQFSGGHSLVAEGTDVCGSLSLREADRLFWGRRQLLLWGPEVTRLRLD